MAELCVFCRRQAAVEEWRPFCSERCRLQDLARWLDDRYRVPGDPTSDAEEHEDSENQEHQD